MFKFSQLLSGRKSVDTHHSGTEKKRTSLSFPGFSQEILVSLPPLQSAEKRPMRAEMLDDDNLAWGPPTKSSRSAARRSPLA